MYGCESWTVKKVDRWRIDASELWCWRRLLRVPCTARRSNQSILKGNQPCIFIRRTDAEAPILWPPDAKNWLIGKYPDVGKDWRQKKGTTEDEMLGWPITHLMDISFWVSSGSWWRTGKPGVLQSMGSQRVRHNWATELNWTELSDWGHTHCLQKFFDLMGPCYSLVWSSLCLFCLEFVEFLGYSWNYTVSYGNSIIIFQLPFPMFQFW